MVPCYLHLAFHFGMLDLDDRKRNGSICALALFYKGVAKVVFISVLMLVVCYLYDSFDVR